MTPNLITLDVSSAELKLITDIQDLGYGEIYNVKVERVPAMHAFPASERFRALLKFLRQGNLIGKLIIHDSEPTLAEQAGTTTNGRACLIKTKF